MTKFTTEDGMSILNDMDLGEAMHLTQLTTPGGWASVLEVYGVYRTDIPDVARAIAQAAVRQFSQVSSELSRASSEFGVPMERIFAEMITALTQLANHTEQEAWMLAREHQSQLNLI